MADPIAYVDPSVRPPVAALLAAFALWLWPAVVTAAVGVTHWRRLRSRVAFLVFGYLTCLGVGALVRSIGAYIFWEFVTERTPDDRVVVALINSSLSATLAGILLSIPLVVWLARAFRDPVAAI